MRVTIAKDYDEMSLWAGNYVARRIIDFKPTAEKPLVLGCPTGSSPIGLYKRLIELNKIKIIMLHIILFPPCPHYDRKGMPAASDA